MDKKEIEEIIKKTESFVKETFNQEGTGHDWWHIHRVRNLAKRIAQEEGADILVVELIISSFREMKKLVRPW